MLVIVNYKGKKRTTHQKRELIERAQECYKHATRNSKLIDYNQFEVCEAK